MYWNISVNPQFIWPHLNFSYNEPSVVIRFPSFYLCESHTRGVLATVNMHICLSNKNEDSLFIFSTDVQNKLPYLGTLFTLSDLLLEWSRLCFMFAYWSSDERGQGDHRGTASVTNTSALPMCLSFSTEEGKFALFSFWYRNGSSLLLLFHCLPHCNSYLTCVVIPEFPKRSHWPVTALSVLGFSDLRMPSSPGSLHNETLGVQEVCLQCGIRSVFDRCSDAALESWACVEERCLGPMHFLLLENYKVS